MVEATRQVVTKGNCFAGDASVLMGKEHFGKLGYIVVDGSYTWNLSR
jgi:hypothetical protein